MPVPPAVDDLLAARGYINPLTAMLMLKRWPVAGKHLVLTAASSSCASLLGQWALAMGARSVSGIIRSPQHRARLEQAGIYPILDTDRALMEKVSQHSDLVFDAVGGELANTLLSVLPGSSTLISYGLLSGRPLTQTRGSATVRQVSSAGGAADTQRGGVAGSVRRNLAAPADDLPAAGPAHSVERLAGGGCRRRPAREEAVRSCWISPPVKVTFSSRQGLGFRQRSSTA